MNKFLRSTYPATMLAALLGIWATYTAIVATSDKPATAKDPLVELANQVQLLVDKVGGAQKPSK